MSAAAHEGGVSRWLIVNADDFGLTAGVNAGIIESHERGIVTSTSLMVDMPGAEDAARLAHRHPALSVGIHVDLTGEGVPRSLDLSDTRACRRDIRSQLECFHRLLDRPPTHVDAHHNVHRLPALTQLFVDLAGELDVPLREHAPVRYFPDFYGQWDDGLSHPEWISPENLVHMLSDEVGPGITELSCHPGRVDDALGSPYRIEREVELATLCHPLVRQHAERSDLQLVSYAEVLEMARGAQR